MSQRHIIRVLAPAAGALALLTLVAACAPTAGLPAAATNAPVVARAVVTAPATPLPAETAQAEAFSAAAAAPATGAPTAEPMATAASTVVPPALAAASQQASLQEEILLAGPPAYAIVFTCDPLPAERKLPAVTWQQAAGAGQVCLYGFAEGEEVRYEIKDGEGEAVDAGTTVPDTLDGPQPAARVMLDVEAYAPGQWTVAAESPSAKLDGTFDVAATARVAVRLAPEEGRALHALRAGDRLRIVARGLPPGQEAAVGVYYAAEQNYAGTKMIARARQTVAADERGALKMELTLDGTDAPGYYCVVVAARADYAPQPGPGDGGATACFTVIEK